MDKIYFLIIAFGFLLAMRGAKTASLQKPMEGVVGVWREAMDLFLTAGLILTVLVVAMTFERTQALASEYAVLGFGIGAYLLSRFQKKTDVFFLAVTAIVFMFSAGSPNLFHTFFRLLAVSAGIALFQTCFLGLRYKLLFSRVPDSAKGWPILCLLAALISVILRGIGHLAF